MRPHTAAKHKILRKYLDAWLPILGAGRWAADDLVLIDGFAGPGRYQWGEEGSPLIMLRAYREHTASLTARSHFFFIEERGCRCRHLSDEIANLESPPLVEVEVIEGTFDREFPTLLERLVQRFGTLPPTFAFIDPFGADDLPVALSSPLLRLPRCEVLVYFPVAFLARFGEQPELEPILDGLYGGTHWRRALDEATYEGRKRVLHDLFLDELRKRVPLVRSFEITPAHEAGGNTYHLVFGTASEQGLRKMKDAMWHVDPVRGESYRDSTLADHPVLFEEKPDFARLLEMLRERFGGRWFTIEEAERFTLLETAFRDNGHLKTPTLKPAEKDGRIEVERLSGQRKGSFGPGTRMRFVGGC